MEARISPPRTRAVAWGEWLFLGLLVGSLLALNIPAQWTGIATDPDFTAWVAPLSNRLAHGLRLYEFGGHMPLPPLSYVLLYWLSGGHATWLTESIANHLAVMMSLLLLYGCMARYLPSRVALLGAVAALATLSASNCVLFYGALPNLLVAGLACVGVGYIRRATQPRVLLWLAGMSFLSVAALLAKQNVGGLAFIGVGALIVVTPSITLPTKIKYLFFYTGVSLLALGVFCWVLSPWVNVTGMIQDVFLTGSECKGGTREIVAKLVNYLCEIGGLFLLMGIFAAALLGANLFGGKNSAARPVDDSKAAFNFGLCWIIALSFIGLVVGIALARFQLNVLPDLVATEQFGLLVCLAAVFGLATSTGRFSQLPRQFDPQTLLVIGALTLILLPAAVGYSLSTPIGERAFYWHVGIIPFIQVALTAVVWLVFAGAEQLPRKYARGALAMFTVIFIAQNWQPWRVHWLEIKNCTQTWPGVPWYAGARVTTLADPLKGLVTQVQSLTKPDDTVLLLPDDPNFEECFERPRPALNCAIIFTDQYWLRYVEDDFARLLRDPPKLIIIGPRDHWRDYSRLRNNTGAVEALIDHIQTVLLPAHYRLVEAHKINYHGGVDYLDVWQRVD